MLEERNTSYKYVVISVALLLLVSYGTLRLWNQPKKADKSDPREKNRVIDTPSEKLIDSLDQVSNHVVFVLTKDYPQFAHLHNKKIVIEPLDLDLKIDYNKYEHKGFMGPIYILLPSYYIGIRANVIMKCFPAYKGFKLKEVSENYALYYTNQAR